MARLLLIEDDIEIAQLIIELLELENHTITFVVTGEEGLKLLEENFYDIMIIDWGLPGISGIEVINEYRANNGSGKIIILTGKSDLKSKEIGLESGGDDYLVKPINGKELCARINAMLRRPVGYLAEKKKHGNIVIDFDSRKVFLNNCEIHLTPKEYLILEFFIRHPNNIFSSSQIINAIWPSVHSVTEEAVRTLLKKLKRKITSQGETCIIESKGKNGYYLAKM